jgi:uncharacterized protein YndB with AHSA1/START domain
VNAPRAVVYRALLDARAVATWMVPTGMTSQVHAFDAREGGSFRISLTYDAPTGTGKTTAHTDTFHGRFVKLVPNEQVVEVVEFEATDPTLRGEMTITYTLADADGGTDMLAVHDGLPPGLSAADNEAGRRMSIEKLAALVEADWNAPDLHSRPPASQGAYASSSLGMALHPMADLRPSLGQCLCTHEHSDMAPGHQFLDDRGMRRADQMLGREYLLPGRDVVCLAREQV